MTRNRPIIAPSRSAITIAAIALGVATCASATSLRLKVPNRVIGAFVQQPISAPPTDETGAAIYNIGGPVRPPIVTYAPAPKLAKEARKDKLSGNVILSLIVDRDGKPQNVQVVQGLSKAMDQSAIETVQRYRFKPATRNGEPVAVYLKVAVNFPDSLTTDFRHAPGMQ